MKLVVRMILVIVLVWGMGMPLSVFGAGEGDYDEAFDLGEIVVTATKSERRASDVTSSVSVIDREEIDASNDTYVMDIIGSLPGIYVQRDAIYGRQGISIRGLGSNGRRLQTLIDGRPEKMSIFGCTVTQTLPLANVERIEIVRGPESVLYGSDALGGVINIITRRMQEDGFETNGIISYGGYDSAHAQISHGGKMGDFDYYLTVDEKYLDGHRSNSRYRGYDLTGRLGYRINDVYRIEFLGKQFDDEAHSPGPESTPFTNDDRQRYKRSSFDLDFIGDWDRVTASLTVFHNRGHHRFTMPSVPDLWHSRDRLSGVLAKTEIEVLDMKTIKDSVVVGYDWYREFGKTEEPWNSSISSPPYYPGHWHRTNHELYLLNECIWRRLVTTIGGRLHYDRLTDWEFVPHLGMAFHVSEQTRVRGKVSKGFRTPKFNELFLFPPATEDLDPERVWSYEGGIDHQLTNWMSAEVNLFYMDIENFIQRRFNTNPPPRYIFRNTGNYVIKGVESGITVKPLPNVDMTFYYTFMHVGNSRDDRQGTPKHSFTFMADYTRNNVSFSFDAEYIDGVYEENEATGGIERIDDYFVVNMKASYWFTDHWQGFIGIDNLFNTTYEMYPEYPMPGTTVTGGLRFSF